MCSFLVVAARQAYKVEKLNQGDDAVDNLNGINTGCVVLLVLV